MSNGNINISGAGTVTGGKYHRVKISGSGRVNGPIQAEDVTISGSGRFEGDVHAEYLTVSGSGHIDGDVKATVFHTSGSCRVEGSLMVQTITVDGSCKIGGNVKADRMSSRGSVRVDKDVTVKDFSSHGSFRIGGSLVASRMDIQLSGGCDVQDVICDEFHCQVEKSPSLGYILDRMLAPFIGNKVRTIRFTAKSIQAKNVWLESSDVEFIKGEDVHIGPNSTVGKVEYTGTIHIDPTAIVRSHEKVPSISL
jgi:cytoskeletal protein CcmA (bactofilin family)